MRVRVAVIGLGPGAEPHAKSLIDLADRVEVKAAASRTEERARAFAEEPCAVPWLVCTTTQRLRNVSMLGRRSIAATAPSSAMTKASASELRSAGTVEPSHNTKPRSGRIRSLI